MYTHSYSFSPDICLHIHSAECTVRMLNQAGRNKYTYNPKFVRNTGSRTRDLWLDKCISNQQLYHLSHYETETVTHFIGQWSVPSLLKNQGRLLPYSHTDYILNKQSLTRIVRYALTTKRFLTPRFLTPSFLTPRFLTPRFLHRMENTCLVLHNL